jgi:hypothetical protein
VAGLGVIAVLARPHLSVSAEARAQVMALDDSQLIEDPALLRRAGAVLGLTIGFIAHGALDLRPRLSPGRRGASAPG